MSRLGKRRVGVALVGIVGGVGSTVAASLLLLKGGHVDTSGLVLAGRQLPGAVDYENLFPTGWDLNPQSLDDAVTSNDIIEYRTRQHVAQQLSLIRPWPAIGNTHFCAQIGGSNILPVDSHRRAIEDVRGRLDQFRRENELDNVVVVNLASTEVAPDLSSARFQSLSGFEAAIDCNDPGISASMLYAYAAIGAGYPFANFTPSFACDIAPIEQLAYDHGVAIAGKDGKTGQTFLKTVLAPALRDRDLRVEGWYSTNLLGNLDGFVLDDPRSRASKIATKHAVLDSILGYRVENHRVDIVYHGSKGDLKEAWDSIDLIGFLGQKMQLKVNFLCADSILAAPLVIELVRLLDLASQRGEKGPIAPLGVFFKSPQGFSNARVVHDFSVQQQMLDRWLETYEK